MMEDARKAVEASSNIEDSTTLLRNLPSVDSLIGNANVAVLKEKFGRELTVESLRYALNDSRSSIIAGSLLVPSDNELVSMAAKWLTNIAGPTLVPVINATGVIIHTNLGRAPLSKQAQSAVSRISDAYSNLEYDLDTGSRGTRAEHAQKLLVSLTKAEAALAVNNNAAAVLLTLSALCGKGEVIISRGQLIEIGGGFRIPDVMNQSGAELIEVGTTNRTHLADYEKAINSNTVAILVAHHSNFKVIGFTSEPSLAELAKLAKEKNILLLYDQGSGAIKNPVSFGLDDEPTVGDALDKGVDLVMFSGDKLLGGPQAGIIVGSEAQVKKIRRHPLARAVRADKMCLAALSATLDSYIRGREIEEIPIWQMIAKSEDELQMTAERWKQELNNAGYQAVVTKGDSTIGGGTQPGTTLKTFLVAITGLNLHRFADLLRKQNPPIIARISGDQLLLDPRTVLPEQESDLLRNIVSTSRSQH